MFTKILLISIASKALGFKPDGADHSQISAHHPPNNHHQQQHHDPHHQQQHHHQQPVYGPPPVQPIYGFPPVQPVHGPAPSLPGHDNCVDVSRYGEVTYDSSTDQICSFKVVRNCEPVSERVCVEVPRMECTMVAGYSCDAEVRQELVRCDTTERKILETKKCNKDGFQILKEIKKKPHCEPITKKQCDSKWEIDEHGEKVFEGNDNCRDVTWEDCKLVDSVVEEEVEVYSCHDDGSQSYLEPVVKQEEVTTRSEECGGRGGAVCQVTTSTECTEVEWTDCEETVVPDCHSVDIKVPSQEYDHLLRCSVGH